MRLLNAKIEWICCFAVILTSCSLQTQPLNLQSQQPAYKSTEEVKKAVWEIRNTLVMKRNKATLLETQGGGQRIKRERITIEQKLNHGTGSFINPRHVVTNFHVVDNIHRETRLYLIRDDLANNRQIQIKVRLLKVSSIYDLALLESEVSSKDFLTIKQTPFDSSKDHFFLFGYPDKRFIITPLHYLTHFFDNNVILFNRTETDILGQLSGSSGGPIINQEGHIVGIHHAGNQQQTVAITTKALNDFLNGNNRSCQGISNEQCIEQEWAYLQRVTQQSETDLSQQSGAFLQAQYNYSIFGGSYRKWLAKRSAFKRFVRAIEDLNTAEYELIKAFNKLNSSGGYSSYNNEDYQKYLEAKATYEEANQNLIEVSNDLNQLNKNI